MKIVGRIDEALDRSERGPRHREHLRQRFEPRFDDRELAGIFEATRNHARLGFCLDTCHAHVAGYDLSTVEGFETVIARFDRLIGLEYLRGLHLNDALVKAAANATVMQLAKDESDADVRIHRSGLPLQEDPAGAGNTRSSIWADEIAHLRALTFKNRVCEVYWPKRRNG